jgi:hypothetical protein
MVHNRKLLRRRRGVAVDRRGERVVEYEEKLAEDSESDHKYLTSVSDYILHVSPCRSDLASALRQVGRLGRRPGESQTMRLTSGKAANPE